MKNMHKLLEVTVCVAVILLALAGCTNPTSSETTFTVTFDSHGGRQTPEPQTLVKGQKVAEPTGVNRSVSSSEKGEGATAYKIEGWYLDYVPGTGPIWGVEVDEETGEEIEVIITPGTDPVYENKWDFATETLNSDITLHAKWELKYTYTVDFELNGGTPQVEPQEVAKDEKVTEPAGVTREGYNFTGWHSSKNLSNSSIWDFAAKTVTKDITLYAKWIPISLTVTFESNGGTPVNEQEVLYDEKVIEPTGITLAGHYFRGWYSNEDLSSKWNFATKAVTKDITLYAKWEIIPDGRFLVTFNSNGGSKIDDLLVKEEALIAPKTTTFAGHNFAGWYKDETFSEVWDFDTEVVTANIILYAKWNEILTPVADDFTITGIGVSAYSGTPKAVTITPNDGKSAGAITIFYNRAASAPVNAGTYTVTFNVRATEADGWYAATGLAAGTLEITRADPNVAWPTTLTATYSATLTLKGVALPGNTGTPGSFSWTADADLAGDAGSQSHNLTFTPTNAANYNIAAQDVTIAVAKAAGAAVAAVPTASSINLTSVTLNTVTAPANGQTVEYASGTSRTQPGAWQDGTTFNGLNAGTAYYFFARSRENLNYNAGATFRVSAAITTKQQTGAINHATIWLDAENDKIIFKNDVDTAVTALTVTYPDSVVITADGSFTGQSWTVNGGNAGSGSSFTFETDGLREPGKNYIVGLRALAGGKPYSAEITVTVNQ